MASSPLKLLDETAHFYQSATQEIGKIIIGQHETSKIFLFLSYPEDTVYWWVYPGLRKPFWSNHWRVYWISLSAGFSLLPI